MLRYTRTRLLTPKRFFRSFSSADNYETETLEKWVGMKPSWSTAVEETTFETLDVELTTSGILSVALNRPEKLNAFNMKMWMELEQCFEQIADQKSIKTVVLKANGRAFSAGMDLSVFATLQQLGAQETCEGRKREMLMQVIKRLQSIISAPDRCRVPVLASIHGPCLGAAVDFITSCDLRYCDTSTEFSVKEVDLAIVADIGTLQRLPLLVGEQRAKELAFTGRHMFGEEAKMANLVLDCLPDKHTLDEKTLNVADHIARQSPITIRGIKHAINYKRDHTVDDSLHQIQQWNGGLLYNDDLAEAFTAISTKKAPSYRND